jgi:hypothetical protein
MTQRDVDDLVWVKMEGEEGACDAASNAGGDDGFIV